MTNHLVAGAPTRRSRFGRFTLHFFEMCAPMCVGFAIGDLIYFWAADKFGYSDPSASCQSGRSSSLLAR